MKQYLKSILVILVVLYGCESWSLILREEYRLNVSQNRILRKIFGPEREEVVGGDSIMRSFIICKLRKTILGQLN
jgi:hypothetical protein